MFPSLIHYDMDHCSFFPLLICNLPLNGEKPDSHRPPLFGSSGVVLFTLAKVELYKLKLNVFQRLRKKSVLFQTNKQKMSFTPQTYDFKIVAVSQLVFYM